MNEVSNAKQLLIVAHMPSANTRNMAEKVLEGASNPDINGVETRLLSPFDTEPEDVMACDAIILGTTENLGYMSGALKDFFDRCYYPCLEEKQGLPYALYIRAGHDGTGTRRGVETIITGLRWREAHDVLLCRGDYQERFLDQCEELGLYMAAGLEAGVI